MLPSGILEKSSTRASEAEDGRRPSVQFAPAVDGSNTAKAPSLSKASTSGSRRNVSPPPPPTFRPSVSFDTFRNPAASNFSLTLNRKHRDYSYTKRSRTFLCGTDTNEYSDTALEWLIDELVDDGDEIVCLRVVEKDSREATKWAGGNGEEGYRAEALRFLEAIEKKNSQDKAISLVLEFSIGKVHDTIQQMIRIYEPAILVVGTRGRSLTGYQGLLTSGSISKYCLQYSPVPVIVVRPSKKRDAKKRKRLLNRDRQGYRDILDKTEDAAAGGGGHLLDHNNRMSLMPGSAGYTALSDMSGDPEAEAQKVAEAIGYMDMRSPDTSPDNGTPMPERVMKSPEPGNSESSPVSDDEDDEARPQQEEGLRPEDEALRLAYERAQKAAEEEQQEAEARAQRARERKERSASRGVRGRGDDEVNSGAAILGVLAQLDRG